MASGYVITQIAIISQIIQVIKTNAKITKKGIRTMNKGYAMGFISSDIKLEIMNLKNGEQMSKAKFSIALQRKSKDAGADFIYFTAFGKLGENIERYFEKGKGIFVEYHVQSSSFAKDGKKTFRTDFIVDYFEFVPVRRSDEQAPSNIGGASFGEMIPTQEQEDDKHDAFINVPDNIADDLPFR